MKNQLSTMLEVHRGKHVGETETVKDECKDQQDLNQALRPDIHTSNSSVINGTVIPLSTERFISGTISPYLVKNLAISTKIRCTLLKKLSFGDLFTHYHCVLRGQTTLK